MKKLLLLILLGLSLQASYTADLKARIVSSIAHIIVNKPVVKVYNDDPYFNDIFETSATLQRVQTPQEADVILTKNSQKIRELLQGKTANIISTHYRDYKHNRDFDISAFFWQKGRPNILLNKKLLQERKVSIPPELHKYLE